jgi:hypothetical protein
VRPEINSMAVLAAMPVAMATISSECRFFEALRDGNHTTSC